MVVIPLMRAITDLRITSLGQTAEISEQTIEIGTGDYLSSDLFTKREKMAILWAEHVTLNTAKEDNGVFERVRQEFSGEEVIELTLMSGFSIYSIV